MRFTDIDINFDVRHEGHPNCPKILSMNILRVFSDNHLWRQNWRQYVWTSLCQFNFFVNLFHSLGVWIFDIWHLFDNLTSFWQFDIFLTIWHLFDILAHYFNHLSSSLPRGQGGVKGYTCMPPYPCTHRPYVLYPIPMYPIAPYAHTPLPHTPCTLLPHVAHTPCTHCPCVLYPIPLYPIAHVTHCPCGPYPLCPHCP